MWAPILYLGTPRPEDLELTQWAWGLRGDCCPGARPPDLSRACCVSAAAPRLCPWWGPPWGAAAASCPRCGQLGDWSPSWL